MVREDFVLKKCQKIGIAVWIPPRDGLRSSLQKAYPEQDATQLDDIYILHRPSDGRMFIREKLLLWGLHALSATITHLKGALVQLHSCWTRSSQNLSRKSIMAVPLQSMPERIPFMTIISLSCSLGSCRILDPLNDTATTTKIPSMRLSASRLAFRLHPQLWPLNEK
jgi:hypothetical protein